jgi:hypothetical protein
LDVCGVARLALSVPNILSQCRLIATHITRIRHVRHSILTQKFTGVIDTSLTVIVHVRFASFISIDSEQYFEVQRNLVKTFVVRGARITVNIGGNVIPIFFASDPVMISSEPSG